MSEHACSDPNARPLTETEQLQRRLDQAREEAMQRAVAYDQQNAFFQSRTDALTARLTGLENALREIANFTPYDATPASYAGALSIVRRKAAAALASDGQ